MQLEFILRAVVQRVTTARVTVDDEIVGEIDAGLLVLVAAGSKDTEQDVEYLANKLVSLRIFSDANGAMNLSVLDVRGAILSVSQFTLYGDCKRGRRPSFVRAAPPDRALDLYRRFNRRLKELGAVVETGQFQADMKVSLTNDGPVTIVFDSEKTM